MMMHCGKSVLGKRARYGALWVIAWVALGLGGCATTSNRTCVKNLAAPAPFVTLDQAVHWIHEIPYMCPGAASDFSDPGCWQVTGVNVTDETLAFVFGHHNATFQIPVTQLRTQVRVHLSCDKNRSYVVIGQDKIFTATAHDARFYGGVLTQLPLREAEQEWLTQNYQSIIARAYVSMRVKPTPGENIRALWVQAKDAIEHKRFIAADNLLYKAYTIAPWWPAAPYEIAFISAKLGDYRTAAFWMRYYLQLVPNGPNARALRDKMYLWQGRETPPAPPTPMPQPYSELPPHLLGITMFGPGGSGAIVFEANHLSSGAAVETVSEGSPAAAAGLTPGDIIIRFAGDPVASPQDLIKAVHASRAGTEIPVEFVRDGQRKTVDVRL